MDGVINAAIPSFTSDALLMGVYGIGIGLFIIPLFIQWIEQDKEYERFFEELRSEPFRRAKTDFFMRLERAYHTWQSKAGDSSVSLQRLMENSEFPNWIPIIEGDLVEKAQEEYEKSPCDLWRFCRELYKEADSYLKQRKYPTLLSGEEIEEFHRARQTLSYFWDKSAISLLLYRKLRYRNIKEHLKANKELLKVLSYLEIELYCRLRESGKGSKYLFYLSAILFGEKKWGFWQWLWNPLLSTSENFRK